MASTSLRKGPHHRVRASASDHCSAHQPSWHACVWEEWYVGRQPNAELQVPVVQLHYCTAHEVQCDQRCDIGEPQGHQQDRWQYAFLRVFMYQAGYERARTDSNVIKLSAK